MVQDFISKLSQQEKKIFYIAMAFVLAAFMDRLFLGPAMSKLSSLDDEIGQQKNVINRDLRFLSYKDKILKEDEDFSIYYSIGYQTEEEIIAAFLKKVEMMATEAGVNLIKVSPSDTRQRRGYMEYYANLECDGALENIATFVHLIDTSKDLLKIVKMNINPKRASAEEVTAAMTVKKILISMDTGSEEDMLLGEEPGDDDMAVSMDDESSAPSDGKGVVESGADATTSDQESTSPKKVSERFSPKAVESKKKSEPEEEVEEAKPSIFERFMGGRSKE